MQAQSKTHENVEIFKELSSAEHDLRKLSETKNVIAHKFSTKIGIIVLRRKFNQCAKCAFVKYLQRCTAFPSIK